MENCQHTMQHLFAQLGLASHTLDIAVFIEANRQQVQETVLYEAKFWTPAQAQFLKEQLLQDADWSVIIDQLNAALHHLPPSETRGDSLAYEKL